MLYLVRATDIRRQLVVICLVFCILIKSHRAFDDDDGDQVDSGFHEDEASTTHRASGSAANHQKGQPMPKDKILLREVKKLTFYRNKRTTSRRTHSIHQLSCVGGTAGCKLFTPDVVECEIVKSSSEREYTHLSKINWQCKAEMSDRVRFNHVEVICEGYDYPEDDYILLGSCGLEFTLDYADPHDYHDNSYFKHLDEHEKELHRERVRSNKAEEQTQKGALGMVGAFFEVLLDKAYILGPLFLLVIILTIIVRRLTFPNGGKQSQKSKTTKATKKQVLGYGPLTSAVMSTKKAC